MTVYQYSNYLMHHGVKGMKWGVRKARDKSSFNTKYRHTMTDRAGRILTDREGGVSRHQQNKAKRSAAREAAAYKKAYGSKARSRDELSVMGNKYDSEIAKYKDRNRQRDIAAASKKFDKNVKKNSNKIRKATSEKFILEKDRLDKKYDSIDEFEWYSSKKGQQYVKEVGETWTSIYKNEAIKEFGKDPKTNGYEYVSNLPDINILRPGVLEQK